MTSADPGFPGGVETAARVGLLAKTLLVARTLGPICAFWMLDENPRPERVVRVPPLHGPWAGCKPFTAKAAPRSTSSLSTLASGRVKETEPGGPASSS